MNAQDLANIEVLEKVIKAYGFVKEDEEKAFALLRAPYVPDEYKKFNIGPDFRVRFPFLAPNDPDKDESWISFKKIFYSFCVLENIRYEEFIDNKKIVAKNTVKLKKVMEDFYLKNDKYLMEDVARAKMVFGYRPDGGNPSELINNFITKSFEFVGRFKNNKKQKELVISFNFADWFLCSTGQDFTSCLTIGHEYWMGLPFLLGDKNRAFMYITEGRKKDWNGIIVDKVVTRSWVLLTDKNEKQIVRMYPKESVIDIKEIRNLTGDQSFVYGSENVSGKLSLYEVDALRLERSFAFMTIYNDTVSIDKEHISKTGNIKWNFKSKGGFQYCSIGTKSLNDGLKYNRSYNSILDYMQNKKRMCDDFRTNTCEECNGKNGPALQMPDGKKLCTVCMQKYYAACEHCGTLHRKEKSVVMEIHGIPVLLCQSCSQGVKKCSICGDLEYMEETKKISGEFVCSKESCLKHIVSCKHCSQKYIDSKIVSLGFNEYTCFECYKDNVKILYNDKALCGECHSLKRPERLNYDIKGKPYCNKCARKHADKKQLRMPFAT